MGEYYTDNKIQNNLLGSLGYTCFASSLQAALCGVGLIQVSKIVRVYLHDNKIKKSITGTVSIKTIHYLVVIMTHNG